MADTTPRSFASLAPLAWSLVVVAAVSLGAVVASCSSTPQGDTTLDPNGGDASVDLDGTNGADGSDFDIAKSPDGLGGPDGTGVKPVSSTYKCPTCPDFPPTDAPPCAPGALAPTKIAYPLDGILFPPNMNVLEVQFTKVPGATLYEVDFTNTITTVKVITTCVDVPNVRGGASLGCGVTLPAAAWVDIANTNRDGAPVKVTVRATADSKCVSASTDKVNISFAKEDLAGGIYYWQSAVYGGAPGKTGGIFSHDFGTTDPKPTPFYTSGTTGTCVGCHNLSRDGVRISLGIDDPDADDEFADVRSQLLDVSSRAVLGGGAARLSPGFQTFTHDHSRMIATQFGIFGIGGSVGFDVFDGNGALLAGAKAIGSGLQVTQPDLSRDDKSLVYVSPAAGTIAREGDHHFQGGSIYFSTFDVASNTIGPPNLFLASGGRNYYYPSFSPDGVFVVFNDAANQDSFYNRNARVKLMHFPLKAGEKPIDLPALNVSDGLTNSWPRWSPFVTTYQGHRLLWLTFSSNRDYGLHLVNKGFDNAYPNRSPTDPAYGDSPTIPKVGATFDAYAEPQIWMAAVIVDSVIGKEFGDPEGKDRSFPAFWLPFQDVNSHNHSAQWVEKVVTTPPSDAGTCVPAGGSCSSAACCADVVCCSDHTCQPSCIK